MIPPESVQLKLIRHDGSIESVKLLLWEECPENKGNVRLELIYDEKQIVKSSPDFFSALSEIRLELETVDAFLRCYGSSKNVYPSPMSLSMGSGDIAHKLVLGKRYYPVDDVWIFGDGPDIEIATVEKQAEFYQMWMKSFKA
jgi:hypothetical protein